MRFVTVGRFLLRHCTVVWSNFYVYFYGNHMIGGQSNRDAHTASKYKLNGHTNNTINTNDVVRVRASERARVYILRYSLFKTRKKRMNAKYISQMQIGLGNASDLRTFCCLPFFLSLSLRFLIHRGKSVALFLLVLLFACWLIFKLCMALNGTCSRMVPVTRKCPNAEWLHDVM